MPGTVPFLTSPEPLECATTVSPEVVEEPTLKDVFCAVNSCKEFMVGFNNQLKYLKDELILMHQEMRKTVERVTTLEERISTVEDTLYPLENEIRGLQEKTNLQAAKLDEIENRLCRNNVRVSQNGVRVPML